MAKQTSEFFLTRSYKERPISAYAELQEAKFAAEASGYTATRHVVSSTTDMTKGSYEHNTTQRQP
jgi:hypothetical protein